MEKIHPLRKAFQEGKAQAEPRHPEAQKQQGSQQKEITEMEAGITADKPVIFS